ncbi:DUF4185 domain-containing protein [Phytoactinopolyspora limicola]|uniref:DUF4185 domain-containing protein n=1 Tax=Phytoactinopolyspora limicola TaxID=2715536 RepID=UPI00140895C4|nr:DUF4185 domain-containing protein [Phytoactinopolyspora limicola]
MGAPGPGRTRSSARVASGAVSVAGAVSLVVSGCSSGDDGRVSWGDHGQVVDIGDGTDVASSFILTGVGEATQVAKLTGPEAINDTEPVAVAGTDLGSMFDAGGRTYVVFGDTFGVRAPDSYGGQGSNWRSNVMAYTTDTDPSDGISFDGWITDEYGLAAEIVPGLHEPNGAGEVTKIPTHGFAVDDAMYLNYMSVHHWGDPGVWDANYAGLARSTDDGETWDVLDEPQWPGESNFIQVSAAHVREGGEEFVYFWSIPAGRFGGAQLMKVPANRDAVEDLDAYRYFAGTNGDGTPIWVDDLEQAVTIVDDTVGELSVMYNEQLDRWLMTYSTDGNAVIREGLSPWGPWSEAFVMTTQAENPGLYSPYLHPKYVSDDGRTIYFMLSLWGPYNVFWFTADLDVAETRH